MKILWLEILVILAALALFLAPLDMAQTANPGGLKVETETQALTPTPAQQTKLELAQKDAIIATQKLQLLQQQVQQAEMGRQQALAALNAQAEAIKKENKWDVTTQFDPNDLKFSPRAAEKAKP